MGEDTVVRLARPGSSIADDPLLLVLRDGARRMLQQVIEAEVEAFVGAHAELEDAHGRRRVVRNGHAPEREIQTGIGPISVRRPKLRDRGDGVGGERIRFTSKVLPPFLRRTKNVEELLPWLYLKGVSTGQFEEALTALLGPDAPGLSASTVRRLVANWQQEHERWLRRDLGSRRYVYLPPGPAGPVSFGDRIDGLLAIDGPTGSTSRRGWTTTGSASSSSSAPTRTAARSCWRSRTATGRARRAGASC